MGGDFRQTLPIQKHATKAQQIDLSIKHSKYWNQLTLFKLTKNMRALENEKKFAEWILNIGNGILNDKDDMVTLPAETLCTNDLADEIFSAPIAREDWESVSNRAILAPFNVEVDTINDNVLEMIKGDLETYRSIDGAKKSDNSDVEPDLFPLEFLQSLRPQGKINFFSHKPFFDLGFPPHELKLKINSNVMLLRNLNIKRGLSNGTRMRVNKISYLW
jgi:hypothetical protein